MRSEIPFPRLGISDNEALSKQPALTTSDAQNVRATDSPTGRVRGAVRSGLERVSSTTVNGANVGPRRALQVTYDSRKVSHTGITPVTSNDEVKWALERRKPCYAGTLDSQSNVFSIDGNATVTKYNATGTLQWSVALPVPDERYTSRALAVDEFGIVYVGISTGGLEQGPKLFAVQPIDDGSSAEVLWQRETEAFVEDVKLYKGRLITLQNKPSTGESWIVAYDGIETYEPAEAFRTPASFPSNALAVGPTGNIYAVAEQVTTTRGRDPRSITSGRITEDWRLADLTDVSTRIWSEYDPATLADLGIQNAEDVTVWPDTSGHGRDLFVKAGFGAPTLVKDSAGRLPAVYFDGTAATPPVLTTGPNFDQSSPFSDQQQTALPGYQDEAGATGYANNAQTVMFILCRPRRELTNAPTFGKGMGFFRHWYNGATSTGSASLAHHIAFNTQSDTLRLDTATSTAGYVRFHSGAGDGTAVGLLNGSGAGGSIAAALPAATASGLVLITVVLNHGTTGVAADHPSQFRVNGVTIDEWAYRNTGNTLTYLGGTSVATEIGSTDFGQAANFDPFQGTLHYMAVLNRYSSNTNSAPITYPHGAHVGGFQPDATGDSELERIEGWIAHRFGVAHILDASHPFTDTKGTPNRAGIASHSKPWLLNQNYQTLAKWAPTGKLKWVATSYTAYRGTFTAQGISGLGYGVAVDADGGIYTVGPHQLPTSPPNDYTQIRKIIDLGDTFTATANVTGASSGGGTPTHATSAWGKTYDDYTEQVAIANVDISAGYHYPRLNCDTLRNVFIPWSATTGLFSGVACIAYDKTGGNGLTGNRALTGHNGLELAFSQNGYVAIPDPNVPVFDSTTISGTNQNAKPRAEFVWLFTDLGTGGAGFFTEETVHKVRLLTVGATTGSPRTQLVVSVAGGSIKKGTATISAPAGSGTLSQPELSATSQWIDGVAAFGRIYLTDRVVYREFDPKTDVVKEYKATKGRIPPRASFLTFWRGRMVVSRMADDGHLWHMSAQGDVYDWDTDPPVVTATQAIDGTSSARIGRCPDIINAFVAMNDDIALILCDHSTWQLTGDPQAGGEFDLVSNVVGGSFGRGQVLDPEGVLYWFGSRGGVYRKTPFGQVERISSRAIERRLQAVDLSLVTIEMVWDYEDEGLRIFQTHLDQNGDALRHWFYDAKNGGWWEDVYGVTGSRVQPTSVLVSDGDDPDDRVLLFFCEDGFVRKVSRSARKDDTTAAGSNVPIAAHVLCGPVWAADEEQQGRIVSVSAELSTTQGSAIVELFASDRSDDTGTPKAEFEARAGRNPKRHVRAKGSYAWVKLRSADFNNRWALEHLEIEAYPAGRKRVSS